jgi:hypothetical protein
MPNYGRPTRYEDIAGEMVVMWIKTVQSQPKHRRRACSAQRIGHNNPLVSINRAKAGASDH